MNVIWVVCPECGIGRYISKYYVKNPVKGVNLKQCRICSMRTGEYREKQRLSQIGDKHYHWGGGKTKRTNGYIEVWIPPDHPFSSMTYKTGVRHHYVMEHRLVMAQHLGRPLTRTEVVHHINGIRDDNRIENLELFGSNGEHHHKAHFIHTRTKTA
jgi:hypothetical protein